MKQAKKLCATVALASLVALSLAFAFDHAAGAPAQPEGQDAKQFNVALLRADGALVPFAQYHHGFWWNPWPAQFDGTGGRNSSETQKTLGGHPMPWFKSGGKAPATWYFWPTAGGAAPFALKVWRVLEVENHSQNNWALMTDYAPRRELAKGPCHGQLGMAVDVSGVKMDGMVAADANSAALGKVMEYIAAVFSSAEDEKVTEINSKDAAFLKEGAFPPSKEQRAKARLEVTKMYRAASPIPGGRLYYVEAKRRYPKARGARDSSCEYVSVLRGWVIEDERGVVGIHNEEFGITDCDEKGSTSVELFNVLTLGKRTFVLAVEHGWEDESYVIYELSDHALTPLLTTFGG